MKLQDLPANAIFDQLAEGVIVADRKGAITYVNDAAKRMHGTAVLGVQPKDYSKRYHLFTLEGAEYPPAELPLARALDGEVVRNAQWVIHRPDGQKVIALGNATPIVDAKGSQAGAVLTIRDVTATHRAQTLARENEETVRAFFETAGIYTAVLDLGETDFTMVMGNARMAAVFGQETLCGQSGRRLIGGENFNWILKKLKEASQSSAPLIIEYPWDFDGAQRWYVATVTPMEGNSKRVFIASLDITDRKAAEEGLATALKAKDALLFEVNHRVKNSLQIIISLLMLQERGASPELASHLREARSRVQTVAKVHERLYESKAHTKVDIAEYLEDLLVNVVKAVGFDECNVEYQFEHRGERVQLGVEHSVPLALIIFEMAMNAAKYAFPNKDQGTVSVTTEAGDGKLLVEVADDGVGADPDASPEGSGLGMKIVRALTAQLKADSGYVGTKEGTKFRIRMPIPS